MLLHAAIPVCFTRLGSALHISYPAELVSCSSLCSITTCCQRPCWLAFCTFCAMPAACAGLSLLHMRQVGRNAEMATVVACLQQAFLTLPWPVRCAASLSLAKVSRSHVPRCLHELSRHMCTIESAPLKKQLPTDQGMCTPRAGKVAAWRSVRTQLQVITLSTRA